MPRYLKATAIRRALTVPAAMALVLAAMLLSGGAVDAFAASDDGRVRNAISDAARPSQFGDDDLSDGLDDGDRNDGDGSPDSPDGTVSAATETAATETTVTAETTEPETTVTEPSSEGGKPQSDRPPRGGAPSRPGSGSGRGRRRRRSR